MSVHRVTVRAGAKVNPLLVIHGRRPDGFHELSTVLLGLALYDEVTVKIAPGADATTVTTDGAQATPDIPSDATNLAARGADAAALALGLDACFQVDVRKAIPSRAGLGG